MAERSRGPHLALLLLGAFEAMVEEVHRELVERGHPGASATLEFALRAIDEGADSATILGERLGVSKQAAAKTVASLEALGYLERVDDPADARRRPLRVTDHGRDLTRQGSMLFNRIRQRWVRQFGADEIARCEAVLEHIAGGRHVPWRKENAT